MENIFALLVIAGAVSVPTMVILAAFRDGVAAVVWRVLGLLWMPLLTFARLVSSVSDRLAREVAEGTSSLQADDARAGRSWFGWSYIGPLVSLVLAVFFAGADLLLSTLVTAAMLRKDPPSWSNSDLAGLGGALWVAVAIFWGVVWLDARSGSPFGPWASMPASRQRKLEAVALWAVIVVLLITGASQAWRQLQIEFGESGDFGTLRQWTPVVLLSVLGVLAAGAAVLSGWAFIDAIGAAIIMALAVVCGGLRLIEGGSKFVLSFLEAIRGAVVSVYDLPAERGKRLWNWLCRFDAVRLRLRFEPLVFEEDRRIPTDW